MLPTLSTSYKLVFQHSVESFGQINIIKWWGDMNLVTAAGIIAAFIFIASTKEWDSGAGTSWNNVFQISVCPLN